MEILKLSEVKLAFESALVLLPSDGSLMRDWVQDRKWELFPHCIDIQYKENEVHLTIKVGGGNWDESTIITTLNDVKSLEELILYIGEENHSFVFKTYQWGVLVTVKTTEIHYGGGRGYNNYLIPNGYSAISLGTLVVDWDELKIESI